MATTSQQHGTSRANRQESKHVSQGLHINATRRSRVRVFDHARCQVVCLSTWPTQQVPEAEPSCSLQQLCFISGDGAGLDVGEKQASPQPEAKFSILCHIGRETPPSAVTELPGRAAGTECARRVRFPAATPERVENTEHLKAPESV